VCSSDLLCDRIGVFKSRLLVVDTPEKLRQSLFGRKIVFHLREAGDGLADAARKLPFVREAKVVENKIVVTVDDPESQNPDIVRALVAAGADIRFVGELRHSLEDVYLQLVKTV
jgi:ABC-2 type transport system ATP-binding protein